MAAFRSLLVGIKYYQDDKIKDFPNIIEKDFALLKEAFAGIGFQPAVEITTDNQDYHERSMLEEAIEEFFDSAGQDDTLVVYLSGHGVHIDGDDFLVMPKAKLDKPKYLKLPVRQTPTNPKAGSSLLHQCQ